uniref:Uncharacterized protein n=1 Tax=Anguilla anguilla TaxID=7936 RepID=A0A0E9W0A2_ANGAN
MHLLQCNLFVERDKKIVYDSLYINRISF